MKIQTSAIAVCGALFMQILAPSAFGQAPGSALEVKSIAEIESKVQPKFGQHGPPAVKLVPADRVVPGDRVIYTLEVRNAGATVVDTPSVSYRIPEHMRYVADSAVGPGAEVSYSIDGGRTFERAENLKVIGAGGKARAAVAADYTDIRWKLKNSLKVNSVAFVRFRALVK